MDTLGQRIKFLRGNLSQGEFAEKVGISKGSIGGYERNENSPSADAILKICSINNISVEWLLYGRNPLQQNLQTNDSTFVMIPRVVASLAVGGKRLESSGKSLGLYSFRSDWINKKGNVSQMVLIDVTGDSMLPEIKHGDMLLIDQSKIDILGYDYYAVGIENTIYIKQLRTKPGQLILHSLNPDYEDIIVDLNVENQDSVCIIGRVLWVGRELD